MDENVALLEENNIQQRKSSRFAPIWKDFKSFVDKGSVFDLAIGLVIGTAFSEIVNSFVADIFSPLIGMVVSSKLTEVFVVLKKGDHSPYKTREEAKNDGAVTWNYGNFIQLWINFFIISLCLFSFMKFISRIRKLQVEKSQQEESDNYDNVSEKECQFCFQSVDKRALKCSFCTSNLKIQPAFN